MNDLDELADLQMLRSCFTGMLGLLPMSAGVMFTAGCETNAGRAAESSVGLSQSGLPEPSRVSKAIPPEVPPPVGSAVRVGGDLTAAVAGFDGDYRFEACRVDTPLPVGYPAPTPPGSIDLKTYPTVRLAEVVGTGDPDGGMNKAFWPLFNHIKKHDIAMTSPVEMNYRGMANSDRNSPQLWSMAFLYREPQLNRTGSEGRVVVRDSGPVTVVALGMKGAYSMSLVQRGVKQIEEWLAANPQWEADGDWRSLFYNGPALLWWNKWAEVQIPVRRSMSGQRAATNSAVHEGAPLR